MNMHKNTNKQGEKILLSGVAAAALGLINAKPQAVKAATLNGNRATKKTNRRTVKTKLNYQTEMDSETAGETATADPADQDSGSQTKVNTEDSTTTGQDQNSVASTSNNDQDSISASDNKTTTERFDPAKATKAQIQSIWYTVPVAFDKETGIFTISSGKVNVIGVNGNLPDIGIHTSDSDIWSNIKEIDITGQVTLPYSIGLFKDLPKLQKITGLENLVIGDKLHTPATSMAEMFENDPNLTTIEGLNSPNFDTSLVSDMSNMFKGCTALSNLDLSSLNTSNVTTMNNMFDGCDNLTSLNLSSFDTSKVKTMNDMFSSCPNLTKLTLGKNFEFVGSTGLKDLSGTWVNTGVDQDSPAKGTNKWTSDELMTNYQGDRDHDTYVRYTGGIVTIHRQDEDGKQLVDQDGKEIPDEKLFGNISDPVTVDTSKEFAGYTFKENKNSNVKAFTSDPQDITLVYTKTPPEQNKAEQVTVYYMYRADNGELVEIPGSDPEKFPKDATQSVVGKTVQIPFKSIDGYTPDSYQINKGDIIKSTNVPDVTLTAKPQSVTLIYTKNSPIPPEQNKAEQVSVYYMYRADNGELVEIPGSDPEKFPKDATQSVVGKTVQIPFKSIDGYTPNSYRINKGAIIQNTNVPDVTLTANPQSVTLIYTKNSPTPIIPPSNNGSGNSTPNSSVPSNNNGNSSSNPNSSGNNGSVNNPSSSNSQGSNSQGSNTGNSNNNSSSASNGQNSGSNLPNNEPNNIPSPVNRKPKTVKPHKTFNKGFNIKGKNAIRNQQLANSLKNNGSSSNARTTSDDNLTDPLPQTGNDKHNSLAMLALGSLALATALGAAWFGRKKD